MNAYSLITIFVGFVFYQPATAPYSPYDNQQGYQPQQSYVSQLTSGLGSLISRTIGTGPPVPGQPGLPLMPQFPDSNRDGRIDAIELGNLLRNVEGWYTIVDPQAQAQTVNLMMQMFDSNGDMTIDAFEYERLWNFLMKWTQSFRMFDTDQRTPGCMDPNELYKALTASGYIITTQLLPNLMNSQGQTIMDACPGTGLLSFNDYLQINLKLQVAIKRFLMDPNFVTYFGNVRPLGAVIPNQPLGIVDPNQQFGVVNPNQQFGVVNPNQQFGNQGWQK